MKEITDDSDAGRLEWMYKGPGSTIDSEEYLLGKAVTNTSTLLGVKNEVERDCLPTSLFGNNSSLTGNTGSLVVEQVDVARKLHEDPLLAIKKKEIEKREQLLKNPMKLKKLHDMLNKQMAKESDNALKSVKKKKKKKKKASRHSSSSEEEGIDVELKKRYKKLKTKLKLSDIYNMSDDDEDNDSESSEYDNYINSSSNKKYKKRNRKHKGYSSESGESSNEDSCKKFTKYKNCDEKAGRGNHKFKENIHKFISKKQFDEKSKKNSVNYNSSSSEEMKSERYKSSGNKNRNNCSESDKKKYDRSTISHVRKYDDRKITNDSKKVSAISHEQRSSSSEFINIDEADYKRKYGLLLPAGKEKYSNKKEDDLKHGINDIRDSDIKKTINSKVSVKYEKPNKSVKLTEAEKEKRRKEMMQNAEWRNELRNKNIQSYKEKEDKEKKREKDYSEEFYQKQLSYAASQGSVEGRIKSNINRIQRNAGDMDKNFARR